ncbi:hypothetical protein AVEN_253891-1 [Araneus ventricosus]|uniref:Uncharacterized protein n=1 Tax=Araneus ventricosus TaxID=182803 RepID=A0A4Y2BGX4_ARAVE|nr:hypothetical protein AVEN_253891-1 [Araneus ventricosus]
MRSGDLLVEVASRKQTQQILKLHSLSTIQVFVKPHETLNTSKGVITCVRLLTFSNRRYICCTEKIFLLLRLWYYCCTERLRVFSYPLFPEEEFPQPITTFVRNWVGMFFANVIRCVCIGDVLETTSKSQKNTPFDNFTLSIADGFFFSRVFSLIFFRMPRKYLTQMEIENVMKDLDAENYDDSDSDFEDELENSILEDNNEVDLDTSANFVENVLVFS